LGVSSAALVSGSVADFKPARPDKGRLPMVYLDPLDQQRLRRGVEHLHALGLRATAEAFAEIVRGTGGFSVVLDVLGEFSAISHQQVRIAGCHKFPPRPLRGVA
jgi:hypothetical protein